MGFFGHLVISAADISRFWPGAMRESGPWTEGITAFRLFERLGDDSTPVERFQDRLLESVPDGFVAVSVWDSDGALLIISAPGRPYGLYWLSVDGVVPHFFPPWTPIDESGERLSEEAEAAQDALWEAEAAKCRADLLRIALPTERAAQLLGEWAQHQHLSGAPVPDIAAALATTHVFVEETFLALLTLLGACASDGSADSS